MKKSSFGKTTLSLEVPDGVEEYSREFSFTEAVDQLLTKKYGEFVKNCWKERANALQAYVDAGHDPKYLVLEEYIGFPVLKDEGVKDGMHRFVALDKFRVRPMTDEEKAERDKKEEKHDRGRDS